MNFDLNIHILALFILFKTGAWRIEEDVKTTKMATDEEDSQLSLEKMALDESPRSPTILPWDNFSNWLHCACVVTFDLELGQAMEVTFHCFLVANFMKFMS